MLKKYYTEIFAGTKHNSILLVFDDEVEVTDAQNGMLTANLSFKEFTEAVKSMHPDNASGPDGLNSAFFQHF